MGSRHAMITLESVRHPNQVLRLNHSNCFEYMPFGWHMPTQRLWLDGLWACNYLLHMPELHALLQSPEVDRASAQRLLAAHRQGEIDVFHPQSWALYERYADLFDYATCMQALQPHSPWSQVDVPIGELLDYHVRDAPAYAAKDWWIELDRLIRACGKGGAFVRLKSRSTKHDLRPTPVYACQQAVHFLISSKTLVKDLFLATDRGHVMTYIVVVPWNDQIQPENEFKVFVVSRQIRAISHQAWFLNAARTCRMLGQQHKPEDLLKLCKAMVRHVEEVVMPKLHLPDMTLDVCYLAATRQFLVLEVKAGNRFTETGSGLLSYHDDALWRFDTRVADVLVRYLDWAPHRHPTAIQAREKKEEDDVAEEVEELVDDDEDKHTRPLTDSERETLATYEASEPYLAVPCPKRPNTGNFFEDDICIVEFQQDSPPRD